MNGMARPFKTLKSGFQILFAFIMLLLFISSAAGENLQDVVYLKNGSIIRGQIIEQIPNQSIKIQTRDGSIFIYDMSEIQKIAKENPTDEYPLKNKALLINPLGLLQFGPIIQGEFKMGEKNYLSTHIRLAGLGILSHNIVEYDELYMSSMAIGFGIKRYMDNPNSPNRVYFGAHTEYGWGSGVNDPGENYEAEFEHSYFDIIGNLGYRWRTNPKYVINVGVFVGMSTELSDKQTSPYNEEYDLDSYILAMFELSFGWEK